MGTLTHKAARAAYGTAIGCSVKTCEERSEKGLWNW